MRRHTSTQRLAYQNETTSSSHGKNTFTWWLWPGL